MKLPNPTDEHEEKALLDIEKFGVHILHVFDPDGENPDFTYSMGLNYSYGHPEVIIYGLPNEVTKEIINSVSDLVEKGHSFTDGDLSSEFLNNYDCCFKAVPVAQYKEHFGWNLWLYGGANFDVLQLVWPNKDGQFPWSNSASVEFKETQPVLSSVN